MFKRSFELQAKCSQEQAFNHIAREYFDNHPRWDPDIVELSKTSDGPIGPGTTGREVREVNGRRFATTFRIERFEPNSAFGQRGVEGAVAENVDYAITPSQDGCTVAVRIEILPRSIMMRLLSPLIRPQIERNFAANTARFHAMLNGLS